MNKHYVTFLYPGVLFPEYDSREIENRDCLPAIPEAAYAYQFYDIEEIEYNGEVLRGAQKNVSGMIYLGGTIRTAAEVLAAEPKSILARNMLYNNIGRVVTTRYGQSFPLHDGDEVRR